MEPWKPDKKCFIEVLLNIRPCERVMQMPQPHNLSQEDITSDLKNAEDDIKTFWEDESWTPDKKFFIEIKKTMHKSNWMPVSTSDKPFLEKPARNPGGHTITHQMS